MTIVNSMQSGRRAMLCLAAAASLALAALSSEAGAEEPCQDPSVAAEGSYEIFYDELGEFFGLDDEKACDKITTTLVSACHKAVANAEKCYLQVFKSVFKDQTTACSTAGPHPDSCDGDFLANEYSNDQIVVGSSAAAGHSDCDNGQTAFKNICMNGFP